MKNQFHLKNVLNTLYLKVTHKLDNLHWFRLKMMLVHTRYFYDAPVSTALFSLPIALFSEFMYGLFDRITKRKTCPICGWSGYEYSPELMGVNYRSRTRCPSCLTFERHRLLFYCMKQQLALPDRVLYIGPNLRFTQVATPHRSITIDIYPYHGADIAGSATALPFAPKTFEWVVCLRVLEHILDDRQALCQMFDVLKPGGLLFISVPLYFGWKRTIEYQPDQLRPKSTRGPTWYCPDHWRDYSIDDFHQKLEESGFVVTRIIPDELHDAHDTIPTNDRVGTVMGLRYSGVLFLCTRPVNIN